MDGAGIPALRDAIRNLHGCDSTWVESVFVREEFQHQVVWQGDVEVFDMLWHPKAKRCYAWSTATTGEKRKFTVVLGLPPVDGPVMAVRVAIAGEFRQKQRS